MIDTVKYSAIWRKECGELKPGALVPCFFGGNEMCETRQMKRAQPAKELNHSTAKSLEYDPRQVANLVRRYQELRSAVELVATRHDRVKISGAGTSKEEFLCILIDVEQGISNLSSWQQKIIRMVEQGYEYCEICSMLGISVAMVKFHARQGILQLTNYLNRA
jgi:DNA-directed RNA polymerase specialized sigma24 family protein